MKYPLSLPATGRAVVTVTHPKPTLWIIELHNGDDNRLTSPLFLHALCPALDAIEKHWREDRRALRASGADPQSGGGGAVVLVGNRGQDKYFCNGLDYAAFTKDPLGVGPFIAFVTRCLTFPLPMIAAINGHCFAGGVVLAMGCDYRVMADGSARPAWVCMNEVRAGISWALAAASLMRAKIGDARGLRAIALEGRRMAPKEALEYGVVDRVVAGGTDAVVAAAVALADLVSPNARGGVWGLIKRDLYKDVLDDCALDMRRITPDEDDAAFRARL